MKKTVFCEIAWMKHYNGVTEDDKPRNGGAYIDEYGYGGEVYNFAPYNHKCYGYVMFQGEQLHIERYDKTLSNHSETTDVTVIWVASDGKSSKIVGWYEHAVMHRWSFSFVDNAFCGDIYFDRSFVAKETDCYLIDEHKRSFVIPRASKAGKGRGMGQSQVWYADSQYAQKEFIPKVMAYLDSVRDTCKPFYITAEEINARAKDAGLPPEQLKDKCNEKYEEGDIRAAIALANLLVYKEDSFRTRMERAILFENIGFYNEAEEDCKMALYYEESVEAMGHLMYDEMMLKNTYLAIELGEKIRKRKREVQDWNITACNLAYLYISEDEFEKAQALIRECENEPDAKKHEWIQDAKDWMEELLEEGS